MNFTKTTEQSSHYDSLETMSVNGLFKNSISEIQNHYYIIILILIFTSCKKHNDNDVSKNEFVKIWQSRKSIIPHKTYLNIKSDSTFEYKDSGCQWSSNSFGTWKIIKDTLFLNSIPSKECQYVNGFGNNCRVAKFGEDFTLETSIKDCKPDERNGDYTTFTNDKFYLKNDTLEYVTNIKFPFNDRIAFFAKN